MVSTFTPNINLEEPARGDDVGTWDTPVNGNMTLVDLVVGGGTTISLNNSPVVLSAAQFKSAIITFNSTLTGNVAITFPTSFIKGYTIRHTCTGSSAFVITLQTTAASGQVVACRPGNPFQVYNDGTNLFFVNLGTEIGGYWDYAGSSVPAWVSACTVPPYLNCDASTFSSGTYPQLTNILGGTTLPDSRGRYRATLNQTTGRITSGTSLGGVDGNTNYASGGSQTRTLSSANLPPVPLNDPGHSHGVTGFLTFTGILNFQGGASANANIATVTSCSAFTGITAGNASPTNFSVLPPTYIGGLTMIRAA